VLNRAASFPDVLSSPRLSMNASNIRQNYAHAGYDQTRLYDSGSAGLVR